MSKLVIDALQEKLTIALDKSAEIEGSVEVEKIEVLRAMMNEFEVPEGFVLAINTWEVGLNREGEHWVEARVQLYTQRNYETLKREVVAEVSANGGRVVGSLLAQASFVQFVAPHLGKFARCMSHIEDKFQSQLDENRKECRTLESAIKEVEDGVNREKELDILRQMKSSNGFDTVITESPYGGITYPPLYLKRDRITYDLVNVKVLKMSASGKSVDVQVVEQLFDGNLRTRTEERVRISNLKRFIQVQLLLIQKVEEGELKVAQIETEKA